MLSRVTVTLPRTEGICHWSHEKGTLEEGVEEKVSRGREERERRNGRG